MKKTIKYLAASHLLRYGILIAYPFVLFYATREQYIAVVFMGLVILCFFIAITIYDIKFIMRALNDKTK